MSLLPVPGDGTRPIADRVKTALFDMLRPRLSGMAVLDLFAGTGGVGIEALSQGATHCTFIDSGGKAIVTIMKNLAHTGFSSRARVERTDAFKFLKKTESAFDLIYVAPPQYRDLWAVALRLIDGRPELVRRSREGSSEDHDAGLLIAQIDPREHRVLDLGSLRETRQRRYGNTLLVFFEPASISGLG
jgi:16S rRNA (guanine(966)-N(2))-methyltransferase RsmD